MNEDQFDEFRLLASRLVVNQELEKSDRVVVKRIVYALSLDDDTSPKDQNDRWAKQQRIEAAMVYLVSRYTDYAIAAKRNLERAKGNERLTLPDKAETGRKYNKEDREALLGISEEVRDAEDQKDASDALLRDLVKLEQMVIRRNDKINDISVNVRRHEEVDNQQ
jgi:hypothetical protein